MTENYYEWHSPNLGRNFRMLTFGNGGRPVILFPTSMGAYYENKDRGMIDAAAWFIDNGKVKIYCPDSIDSESWYNNSIPPAARAYNHTCYDSLILHEVTERARQETGAEQVVVAGCSFGGYHAANFSFRHPAAVSHLLSMSGAFDIKSRVDGYYDDAVYFNNPLDYLPGDNDPALWQLQIVLGTAEHDICREQNEAMSQLLSSKGIAHWLDIRPGATHDWPVWREMFPHYLSLINDINHPNHEKNRDLVRPGKHLPPRIRGAGKQ